MVRLLRWTLDLLLRYPLLFWGGMAANVAGVIVGGWFWYGPMLTAAPIWAVLFIPDCPLAALLATVALLGIRYGRQWSWFNALAAFGCIKYGLWTLAFWLRHWTAGGAVDFISVAMFITHVGLICEGLLLTTRIGPLELPRRLAVVGVYALSAFVDYGTVGFAVRNYGFPFYPPLTDQVSMLFVMGVAVGLTAALAVALLALPYGRRLAAPGAMGAPADA